MMILWRFYKGLMKFWWRFDVSKFDEDLMKIWWRFDDLIWWMFDEDFMKISWRFHECLMNVWWMFDECLMKVWWKFDESLMKVWWRYVQRMRRTTRTGWMNKRMMWRDDSFGCKTDACKEISFIEDPLPRGVLMMMMSGPTVGTHGWMIAQPIPSLNSEHTFRLTVLSDLLEPVNANP